MDDNMYEIMEDDMYDGTYDDMYEIMEEDVYDRVTSVSNRRKLSKPVNEKRYPLHYYVRRKPPESVLDLIKNGADINQQDEDGYTPLIIAVRCGTFEIVCMLLYYGADATIPCENNMSPFMYSIFRMDVDMQEQLFEYETDFSRVTFAENLNMLDLAIIKESPHVVEIARRCIDNLSGEDCQLENIFTLCNKTHNDETFKSLWDFIGNIEPEFHICCYGILEKSFVQGKYHIFNFIIESEKLKYILDELHPKVLRYLLDRACRMSKKDLYEKMVYILMSLGFPLKVIDLEAIYLMLGYCEMFRNLLYMHIIDTTDGIDIRDSFENSEYNNATLLLTYIIYYIAPGFTVKDVIQRYRLLSCRSHESEIVGSFPFHFFEITNMRLFLDYCTDYNLCQEFIRFAEDKRRNMTIDNEMWPKLKPTVPSLLELSRNAFRYAACTKFNMTSSCQFYTYINSLHIPGTIKKIISFEKPIY